MAVQVDAACTINRGFVRLHGAAAAGELPKPARDTDAAAVGIALSAVAGTVAANYQTCLENAEQLRALQAWARDMAATLRYCPGLAAEPEGRLVAIIDFTFNLGAGRLQTSTLRRRINQRDWPSAAHELCRWVYGGGKVLPGLVTRREADAALLLRNA